MNLLQRVEFVKKGYDEANEIPYHVFPNEIAYDNIDEMIEIVKLLKDNIKLKTTPIYSEKEGRYLEKYTLEIDEALNKETFKKLKEALR